MFRQKILYFSCLCTTILAWLFLWGLQVHKLQVLDKVLDWKPGARKINKLTLSAHKYLYFTLHIAFAYLDTFLVCL